MRGLTRSVMALIVRATLAGTVAPLEDDADLQPLMNDPLLQFHKLDMQLRQFALIIFGGKLAVRRGQWPVSLPRGVLLFRPSWASSF
jgi:hypothetical protein